MIFSLADVQAKANDDTLRPLFTAKEEIDRNVMPWNRAVDDSRITELGITPLVEQRPIPLDERIEAPEGEAKPIFP